MDHRLGPDARIRDGREYGVFRMVEPLHRVAGYFSHKMPLWLAYDHWTGLRIAENIVARQMAQASDPSLVPGTQAFLIRWGRSSRAQSPELMQRAHELLGAPHFLAWRLALNLPAFFIALVITAILVLASRRARGSMRRSLSLRYP